MPEVQTWLDYQGKGVQFVNLNGTELDVRQVFKGQRISLSSEHLKLGVNEIKILFQSAYRNDGCGMHSFTDPEDGEQYIYSQFEVFYSHCAFPCFEQPDLRAPITLTTFAPEKWTTIGNGAI